jgi:DNA polymerase-4
MDAFFASVEQRNNPHLQGKPVIVGGPPNSRGVVATCSYEARVYGIHSAMSSAEAGRRCPHGIFVSGNYSAYVHASGQVLQLLQRFAPTVIAASIDEAALDVSDVCNSWADAEILAREIKAEIQRELHLTASLGLGPNRLLAKIASGLQKPDGLTCITPDRVTEILSPLPADKIWGVGPVTYRALQQHGIETIGDLFGAVKEGVRSDTSPLLVSLVDRLTELPVRDDRDEDHENTAKSMSHGETLANDIYQPDQLNALLLRLADKVVMRLVRDNLKARTVGLRLRYPNRQTITRDRTLRRAIDDFETVYATVKSLVPQQQVKTRGVRLVGVRLSNLVATDDYLQTDLFGAKQQRELQLRQTIRELRDRFGDSSLRRATSLISPK